MNELLAKLSSYNLFNYLLPGVLFAVLTSETTPVRLVQKDIVTGVFVYYFIGLVVSRFGSLVLEPIMKKFSFVHFAKYSDFVSAATKDPKIEILSEVNNTYRTFSSLFILLILLNLYVRFQARFDWLQRWQLPMALIALLFLFLFSYRKQTTYIKNRIGISKI